MKDKKVSFWTMVAILLLSLSNYTTGSAVSPALQSMQEAFWHMPTYMIKLTVSLPAIAIIPTSLVAGKLAGRLSNRRMALTGLFVYLVGGVGAFFVSDLVAVLLFRVLLGVGAGMIIPLSVSLIGKHFFGDERTRMTGYSTATASFGAAFLTLLAGLLAEISWRHVFLLYAVMLPVFVLVYLFVEDAPGKEDVWVKKQGLNMDVIKGSLYMFLITTLLFSMYLYVANLMSLKNLGGPREAGLVLLLPNISGILVGYYFCHIKRVCRYQLGPLGLLMMALGFYLLGSANSLWGLCLGVTLNGLGTGVINPLNYLRVVNAVSESEFAFTIAIANSFLYLGQFASTLIYEGLLGLGWLHGIAHLFWFNGVLCTLGAFFFAVRRQWGKRE